MYSNRFKCDKSGRFECPDRTEPEPQRTRHTSQDRNTESTSVVIEMLNAVIVRQMTGSGERDGEVHSKHWQQTLGTQAPARLLLHPMHPCNTDANIEAVRRAWRCLRAANGRESGCQSSTGSATWLTV